MLCHSLDNNVLVKLKYQFEPGRCLHFVVTDCTWDCWTKMSLNPMNFICSYIRKLTARRIGNLFYSISNIFIGLGCCTRNITWTFCVRFYLVILIRDFYNNYKNVPDKNQLCRTCLHYKETQNVFYLNRKFNGPFFPWKLHCKWRLSVSYLFFCFLFSLFLKVMNYKFQGIDPG